jgi:hypothetical protein
MFVITAVETAATHSNARLRGQNPTQSLTACVIARAKPDAIPNMELPNQHWRLLRPHRTWARNDNPLGIAHRAARCVCPRVVLKSTRFAGNFLPLDSPIDRI